MNIGHLDKNVSSLTNEGPKCLKRLHGIRQMLQDMEHSNDVICTLTSLDFLEIAGCDFHTVLTLREL